MTINLDYLQIIINASLLEQLVLLSLLLASLLSWAMILSKYKILKEARTDANEFEERFWSVEDLAPLYNRISAKNYVAAGMEKIFEAGFQEFAKLRAKTGMGSDDILEGAQRAMRVALNREIEFLETNLSFLATVGSTSPYVGLFGTVWGIMNSFQALGNVQQATINMVAPGISQALVATAMGLFAAIPAVIAYNRYSNDVERLINRYDTFQEEFSSILHRHAHT